MTWPLKYLLLAALLLSSASCGFPSDSQVIDEFKGQNPTYQALSATVGEGHGDAAYYHIKYKKPGDDRIYEQVWLYLRAEDGKIKLYNKEAETLIK